MMRIESKSGILLVLVVLGWTLAGLAEVAQSPDGQRKAIPISKIERKSPVDFEKEILPILKNNCLACHNKTTTKAGLILETPQDILKGGESGKVILPKHGSDSLLLKSAAHQVKPPMPPRSNKVGASDLTSEELGLLKLWIDQGGKGEVRGSGPIVWQPLPETLNPIYAASVSPDGQFAACGRGGQIFIYSVPTRQLITRLTDPQLLKGGLYGKPGVAHRDLVNSLAFSPDGQRLASGGFREAKLWRRPKDVQRLKLPAIAPKTVTAVATGSNSKWMATGGDDGVIRLWNQATGKSVRRLSAHKAPVTCLAFSSDGTMFLSASMDGRIRVWDTARGKALGEVQTLGPIHSVAWVSAGSRIASAGDDGSIRVWLLNPAKRELALVKEIKAHEGPATSLAAVASNQVISGGRDGTIRQWNLDDGQLVRRMEHGGPVLAVAARPDGKRFASAGLNNVAKLWEAADGKEIAVLKGDRSASEFQAAKERNMVFATNEISYWKNTFQAATNTHKAQLEKVKKAAEALAAAEKVFGEKTTNSLNATAARAAAELGLAEFAEAKKAVEVLETSDKASARAAEELKTAKENPTTDKSLLEKLAAETALKAKAASEAKTAFDKIPAEVRDKFKAANDKFNAAVKTLADAEAESKKADQSKMRAASDLQLATKASDAAQLAADSAKGSILLAEAYLVKAAEELQAAKKAAVESEKPMRAVAFSGDNLLLATAGDDFKVHTWESGRGGAIDTMGGHTAPVTSLAFADDGALLSGSMDRDAVLWELNPAWVLERTLGSGEAFASSMDRVNALRFSPDGSRLATGGGEPTRGGDIRIWQVSDGRLMQSFTNVHSDAVVALDFSPDGNHLASGASDKFAKVLDLATGKVVKKLEGHTHHVLGVSWKRDGRTLATAGADNVVKIWDYETGERRKTIEDFAKEVTSIAFIGSTDRLLTSCGDNQVQLTKDDGGKVLSFKGGAGYMNCAAVTEDGMIVIAGGHDSILRVWNGSNAEPVATFPAP